MDYNIQGKTAIIGGSSKGLGKACAVALAKEGANIVLCARKEESLHNTKQEIEFFGVEVLALAADMASAEDNRMIVGRHSKSSEQLTSLSTTQVVPNRAHFAISRKMTSTKLIAQY